MIKFVYKYRYYIRNLNVWQIFYNRKFVGWGRKKTGRLAVWCQATFGGTVRLHEDGFIRSIGLGIEGSKSFSLVEDDIGIYYDATMPSRLENILNSYDFEADKKLMTTARKAIDLIKKHNISKYNNALDIDQKFCQKYQLSKYTEATELDVKLSNSFNSSKSQQQNNILIIAQTEGDKSLEYGLANQFSTGDMIQAAINENPLDKIYLKIHPDVLSGKKSSDININNIDSRVVILSENVNPISLLKYFDKIYTKTSGMGFEALLVGCECVCFGIPYYSGWGITDDRLICSRRTKKPCVEEVFAAAYILYTRYVNPYTKKQIDIIETIKDITRLKNGFD